MKTSIFQQKKTRIETIEEAMKIFADRLTEPGVIKDIEHMLASREESESPILKMSVSIHHDHKYPDTLAAKLITYIQTRVGQEHYFGLK